MQGKSLIALGLAYEGKGSEEEAIQSYKKAASLYPIGQLMKVIHALNIADQKSKGVEAGSISEGDIYKDLIFNILN